jgi:hypothetical protein
MTYHLIAAAESNAKLAKMPAGVDQLDTIFHVFGLSLAAHTVSGFNVCSQSTPACRAACVLDKVGRANMPNVRDARVRKTRLLFENPGEFHRLLRLDFEAVARKAAREGFTPLMRLDVASDLGWFRYARDFPEFRFYGYTKVASRFTKPIPANLQLTYSWNELSVARGVSPRSMFDAGQNVAVVVDAEYGRGRKPNAPLPAELTVAGVTAPVIDGDAHDWRIPELDGRGNYVALRFKGSKAARVEAVDNGFCVAV